MLKKTHGWFMVPFLKVQIFLHRTNEPLVGKILLAFRHRLNCEILHNSLPTDPRST